MPHLSIIFLAFSLLVSGMAAADLQPADRKSPSSAAGECLRLTVAANDLASFGDHSRQHYRIVFENQCDTVRIVYWCAEHPSKTLATAPCMRTTSQQAGIAAPLYAVVRQREFQWTFPPGTRIRYVDCSESSFPTSDFRCAAPGKRP
jgi:hypothetical protein